MVDSQPTSATKKQKFCVEKSPEKEIKKDEKEDDESGAVKHLDEIVV